MAQKQPQCRFILEQMAQLINPYHTSRQGRKLHLQTHLMHFQVESSSIDLSNETNGVPSLFFDIFPLVTVLQDDAIHDTQLVLTQGLVADARVDLHYLSPETYDLGLITGVLQLQEGPRIVISDLSYEVVLYGLVLEQGLQVGQPHVQQVKVCILLLKDFVLIIGITFVLILLMPVLGLILSVVFHNRGEIFVSIVISLFIMPVTVKSFILVQVLLPIFSLFALIIVLVSSIALVPISSTALILVSSTALILVSSTALILVSSFVPVITPICIILVIINIILIVVIEFVKWLADLWLWTGVRMGRVVVFGRQLDLILKYLQHSLYLTDLQHFVLCLEGKAFTSPSLNGMQIRIDLILSTLLNNDLDDIQSRDVLILFILDGYVFDRAFLAHIRQYFLHQSGDLHPKVFLGTLRQEKTVDVSLSTVSELLDSEINGSALCVKESTQGPLDLIAF